MTAAGSPPETSCIDFQCAGGESNENSTPQGRLRKKLGGINDVTLWRITRDDPTFPVSIQINKRVVGWLEHEIDTWLGQKAAAARTASNNAAHP